MIKIDVLNLIDFKKKRNYTKFIDVSKRESLTS